MPESATMILIVESSVGGAPEAGTA
jgi:hypothetical protein